MAHERALVVSKFWAGILSTVIGALVVGVVGYAVTANADAAATAEKIKTLQADMDSIKKAQLDVRLARMEEKIDWLVRSQSMHSGKNKE